PAPARALHQPAPGESGQQRRGDQARHQPALGIERDEAGTEVAVGMQAEQPHPEAGDGGDQRVRRGPAELKLAPPAHEAVDGADQGVDRRTGQQQPIHPQHDRLQVPESHGEALHQPTVAQVAGGGTGDEPHHQQAGHGHAGVDQRVKAVEDDGERPRQQPEPDPQRGHQQRGGDGDPQHGLLGGPARPDFGLPNGHQALLTGRSTFALQASATRRGPCTIRRLAVRVSLVMRWGLCASVRIKGFSPRRDTRMKHPLALALAIALSGTVLIGCTAGAQDETAQTHDVNDANPLFVESQLPLHYPPFDKIQDSHFGPAFDRGMAEHLAEIEEIAANPEPATFDNTIIPLEKSGELLSRTSRVFFNLAGVENNDEKKAIQAEYAPKLSAHRDAISRNPDLFARIKSLYEQRNDLGLDAEAVRLVERYHTDFVRSGAELDDSQKARLKEINGELAKLGTQFSQNVLAEVNDSAVLVDTREELAGLTDEQIAAAAKAASDKGEDGKFLITLLNTTGQPPLAQLENRELRERIYKASIARGARGNEYDNREIISSVLKLRDEKAKMLGYENFAAYVLADETAGTPEAVSARGTGAVLQAMIDREQAAKGEPSFELQPWDWAYYTEKVRADQYTFDESQLRPYFEMTSVLEDGVFYAMNKFYGLDFKRRT